MTVSYLGNAQYLASAPSPITFMIVAGTATTTTGSINSTSFNPQAAGTAGMVSVHVNCNSACGQVDFKEDGAEWATVPINASGNFVSTGTLPVTSVGPHTITLNYLGNAQYLASASNPLTFTIVAGTATTTSATISSSSFTAQAPGIVSVHVNCNSACGQVDFREDGVE